MDNQKQDTQQQSQENIPDRKSICTNCGNMIVEKWLPPYKYHMQGREFTIGFGQYETKSASGKCAECHNKLMDERRALIEERERAEKEAYRKKFAIEMFGGIKPYEEFTFEKYRPMENMVAYETCKKFNPLNDNLFIYGPTGVGKTHLAVAIAREWFDKHKRVEYWKTVGLLRHFRYKRSAEDEEEMIDNFANAPVLVLDDLGAQKETDFGTMMILEIIDRRIERKQNGLIVTSNYGLNDLANIYKDRIPSRIVGICGTNGLIKLQGTDKRVTNVSPEIR